MLLSAITLVPSHLTPVVICGCVALYVYAFVFTFNAVGKPDLTLSFAKLKSTLPPQLLSRLGGTGPRHTHLDYQEAHPLCANI